MKQMSGNGSTILILGAEAEPEEARPSIPGVDRVPVETIRANLKTVMESVSDLVHATQKAVGDIEVAHVDVNIGISTDGSVGLLGTGGSAGAETTLKVRLQIRRGYRAGY
jgi:NTP-dependent ternary system trypsin peptidase co-occuring protein